VPYLSHLMAVASLVLEAGGDEDMAMAALLHDVVEDCGGMPRLREVRQQFGPRVAKIVEGCTDSFGEPRPEWMKRKKEYLREVKHADAETRLVSASDNCTTSARFWRITGGMAKRSGSGSAGKRKARSGTIAP